MRGKTIDILSDVLRTLRLQGTVYFRAEMRAPWGFAIPRQKVASFHILAEGEAWLRLPGCPEPQVLRRGDVLVFPHGSAHSLLSSPQAGARSAADLLEQRQRNPGGLPEVRLEGRGPTAALLCGHFSFDRRLGHPLFLALPEVLHISPPPQRRLLETAAELAVAEASSEQAGAGALVDRLAEILLLETLRAYLDEASPAPPFFAALEDPAVSKALALMHDNFAKRWTLAELADRVGLSRTVFADRFRKLVQESPGRYLAQWRMAKANEFLTTTALTTAAIAHRVGYHSEFSFAKAFKLRFGEPPGAFRRRAQ